MFALFVKPQQLYLIIFVFPAIITALSAKQQILAVLVYPG